MKSGIASEVKGQDGAKASTHVFNALQYLKKLCTHPSLVVTAAHPRYRELAGEIQGIKTSAKLTALGQLLSECGIGASESTTDEAVVQHRVLLFAQQKATLDLIERELFQGQFEATM